jgi:hypothetical protein
MFQSVSIPNDCRNVVSSEFVGIDGCELVGDDNPWSFVGSKSTKVSLVLAIWVVLSHDMSEAAKIYTLGWLLPCTCNQFHHSRRPYRQPIHMQLPINYIRWRYKIR